MKPLHVWGVGLWMPGFPDAAAWRGGEPADGAELARGGLLPPRIRRRCSGLTRAIAESLGQCLAPTGTDPAAIPTVYASALGEIGVMGELMDCIWRGDGVLSPARFAASVHNAASGQLSIATGNRGCTTSIAAGFDTPAAGLLEAATLLAVSADGDGASPVAVIFGDETFGEPLLAAEESFGTLAVALLLGASAHPAGSGLCISALSRDAEPSARWPERVAAHRRNPCAGALALVDALLEGREGGLALGSSGSGWVAEVRRGREDGS